VLTDVLADGRDEGAPILIGPGPGFGDGTHPTTQLCLQAITALAPSGRPFRMLDFGSGSGILSIHAARLAGEGDAIEIDPGAIEHARRNALANHVDTRIRHAQALDAAPGPFDLVVANILRGVLLDFAAALVARLAAGGTLVLSGLISTDVPETTACYVPRLGGARPEVYERGEWRALVWRGGRRPGLGGAVST